MPKQDHRALPLITFLESLGRVTVAQVSGSQAYLDQSITLADLIQSAVDEGLFDTILPTDSTLTIVDSDGTTLYTINVPNGSALSQAIADGTITVNGEVGTGSILAEGSYEVILNNSIGPISSGMVSVVFDDVAATATVTISDFTIRVNGTPEESSPVVPEIGVNLEDSNGIVPYIGTSFVSGFITIVLDTVDITVTGDAAAQAMGSHSPGDTPNIDIVDTGDSPVAITKISDSKVQIDDLPVSIVGHPDTWDAPPQTQKEDGYCGTDYYALSCPNYFGNTLRFTGKTGGGYNGTNYVDVNGVITTYALAYPDDMVLIHDMIGHQNSSVWKILCMWTVEQSADSYNNHVSASDNLVHGGIGPNRWFLGSIDWFFRLSRNRSATEDVLDHPPFTITAPILTTDTESPLSSSQTVSFRPQYNQSINRNKVVSEQTVFWCWYDLLND